MFDRDATSDDQVEECPADPSAADELAELLGRWRTVRGEDCPERSKAEEEVVLELVARIEAAKSNHAIELAQVCQDCPELIAKAEQRLATVRRAQELLRATQERAQPALQSIGGHDLIAKIGEGGMGSVYKGRHQQTGQIVAIKIMTLALARNTVLLERFEREFRAASRLDHPNLVRALDYRGTGSTPFIVMEFVDGETLGQRIEREGKMNEAESVCIIAQVCQGLYTAHKHGLIHRDIKPDNILLTRDGVAKIADMGLVKELDADRNLTATGRGLGTPHFMPPEQFRDARNASIHSDIYSVAMTLYMMVTGKLPFGETSGPLDAFMKKINDELIPPRQVAPEISERTDWAIRRAMSADPSLRPSSCREFVEDLTGQSTRKSEQSEFAHGIWYLLYTDENGTTHTVKGKTEGIRRSLREGWLGNACIRVGRTEHGPFEDLKAYPEFRDLVVTLPVPKSAKTERSSSVSTSPSLHVDREPHEESPRIELQSSEESESWLTGIGVCILVAVGACCLYLLRK